MPREDLGRRLPVDPRIVERVSRSSTMLAEQGPNFMQDWGGTAMYQAMSKAPFEARVIYYGVVEGTTSPEELEIVTGLDKTSVERGLQWLKRKGYVSVEEIS